MTVVSCGDFLTTRPSSPENLAEFLTATNFPGPMYPDARTLPDGPPGVSPAAGPVGRAGPRPLGLHLRAALASAAAAGHDDARERAAAVLAGLRAYWRHPYRAAPPRGRVVWGEGSSALLDLGPEGGDPVLVLPSLVNRARILDLVEGRSLLGHLSAAGLRPFLLDWGAPGRAELGLGLAAYAHGRAGAALRAAARLAGGRPPALLGHCMGGLLALALAAAAAPGEVAGVALLATPWDFHAGPGAEATLALLAPAMLPLTLAIGAAGAAPVELVQAWFALVEPGAVAAKFAAFGAVPEGDPRRELFVAVEDWLNDGVALPGPVALEALWHWYGANLPARGLWEVGGIPVRPERLGVPFFLAVPRRDRIVPPESAAALAALVGEAATVVRPGGGHIAMIVGRRAPEELYLPLAAWLRRMAGATGRGEGA
jgi:polyhydroxyalkanoate synthase subunit PhaC